MVRVLSHVGAAWKLLLVFSVVISSMIFVSMAFAGTVTWSGDTLTGDGTFVVPYNCTGSYSSTPVNYDLQPLYVSADGSYTFEAIAADFDTHFALYEGSFDASSPFTNCIAGNDDGGTCYFHRCSIMSVNLDEGVQYYLVTSDCCNYHPGHYTNEITGAGTITLGILRDPVTDENGFVQFEPNDGRMNHSISDRAAPVASYCHDWGIEVWQIDPVNATGINPPAIFVSWEEIEATGVPTDQNVLLAENNGVAFYRLTTGEFQVNTTYADGKPFILVWSECDARHSYHLAH
jgi:hypothetical protein